MFTFGKAKKAMATALAVGMLASFVTGCGGGDKKAGDSKAASGQAEVFKFGVTNFADSLEPTDNYFGWVVLRYGLGECLTKFDDKMNVQPWVADKWSVSDDKLTWTFHIRDNMVFSNGKKVDGEAVKKSFERVFEKSKRAGTFFTPVKMEAKGQDIMITTQEPMANLNGALADPLWLIVDVTSEKSAGGDRDFSKQGPICTGPYMVKSFVKEKAVMAANDKYWGGQPPYKTLEIPSIDDPNTRAMALQSGEIDAAVNIAAGDIGLFRGKDKFKVSELASLRVVISRLNMREGRIMNDKRVREALVSSLDRETYNKVLLKGTFIPGKAPVPPSLDYGFDQLKDPNAYNVERSRKLLAEAGWKDTDGDGILDKDGKPLQLTIVTYNSRAELPLYAEAIQADAKKVGIDIKINSVDYNLVDRMGINGEFDLMITNNITAPTGDPEVYLNWYWRTNVDGNNPQNGTGYSNPEYDELMANLALEFDKAKRREMMIKAQQIILDDCAGLFLGYPQTNMVSSSKIQGAVIKPADYYWVTMDIKPAK